MNTITNFQKIIIVIALAISLIALFLVLIRHKKQEDVLSENVTVTSDVPHIIKLSIKPESRIPPIGNDSVPVVIEIRSPGGIIPLMTFSTTADSNGLVDIGEINTSSLPPGNYDIAIKALSHLRSVYSNQSLDGPAVRNYSLLIPLQKAGDTNPTADNYVNSLDISYITLHLYGNDLRADLTHDGIINSLDYAALLKNLYEYGEN